MKKILKQLVVLGLGFFVLTSQASPKIVLRVNLQKGATYEMNQLVKDTIEYEKNGKKVQNVKQIESTICCKVLDAENGNNFLIEHTFKRMKIMIRDEVKRIDFDSDLEDKSNPLCKEYQQIKPVKIQLNSRGEVTFVSGMEEILYKMDPDKEATKIQKFLFNKENLKSLELNYFPEKEIGVGDTWTITNKLPGISDDSFAMNFVLSAINGNLAEINYSANNLSIMKNGVSLKGKILSSTVINITDGFARTDQTTESFVAKDKMLKDENGLEIPVQIVKMRKTEVKKI